MTFSGQDSLRKDCIQSERDRDQQSGPLKQAEILPVFLCLKLKDSKTVPIL